MRGVCTDACVGGCVHEGCMGWMYAWMHEGCMHGSMAGWDGCMHGCMVGGCMDAWIEGCMHGEMDTGIS